MPVFAQLESAALRARFGPPLNVTVDYGAERQVCSIEVPALSSQSETDEFLAELAPDSMRGKVLNRGMEQMSLAWASFVDYEHVTISVTGHWDRRDGATVRFKTYGCQP
jgi:hypothetical protein